MNRPDDSLDKINSQRDQLEGRILERGDSTENQASRAVSPGVGWAPRRRLTVCLDVLGRHVDRLRFLDILLGSRPALNPAESFYHRILSGNSDEAFEQAENMLKTKSLSNFYDEVAIEGLRLAAIDAHRGGSRNDENRRRYCLAVGPSCHMRH